MKATNVELVRLILYLVNQGHLDFCVLRGTLNKKSLLNQSSFTVFSVVA